ncbi:MAG TPA: hypothetical protein PK876_04290 [Elusimicrobiota bacterium]|nr:hypothetical protein [Elusimicrobiota bacterium]
MKRIERTMLMVMAVMLVNGVALVEAKGKKPKGDPAASLSSPAAQRAEDVAGSQKVEGDTVSTGTTATDKTPEVKGPRIVVEGDKVRFLDEKGNTKNEMKLHKNKHIGKVPSKFGLYKQNPEAKVQIIDEETSFPSPNGKYISIVHEDAIGGDEFYEGKRILKMFDNVGSLLWEKEITESPWYSKQGNRIILLATRKAEEGPQKLSVIETSNGNEVYECNAYQEIVAADLSPDGRYLAFIYRLPGEGIILRDLETVKSIQKDGNYSTFKVFNDGTAELYKSDGYKDYLAERISIK